MKGRAAYEIAAKRSGNGRRGWVEPATPASIEALIARIPPEDDEDMRRGWGMSSAEAVRESFARYGGEMIMAETGEGDAEPVCLIGIAPDGNVWMMRGEGMGSVAVQFIRQSRPYLEKWLAEYGHIFVFFWKENRRLLNFLEWIGFETTDLDNGYVRCDLWALRQPS